VERGFRRGRQLILAKAETTIGRAESCDIGLFGDPAVQRLHARIVLQGNRYVLADAGTPDGTFLNGTRISGPAPLRSGDEIRVGGSVLSFRERARRDGAG
jgi:pSer/pThr/pTyr-binding forkhead associated (FHA) protein